MNNYQKHINKMTKVDLYYENFEEKIISYYKDRKKLRNWSKRDKTWEDFKRFSEWIRED